MGLDHVCPPGDRADLAPSRLRNPTGTTPENARRATLYLHSLHPQPSGRREA